MHVVKRAGGTAPVIVPELVVRDGGQGFILAYVEGVGIGGGIAGQVREPHRNVIGGRPFFQGGEIHRPVRGVRGPARGRLHYRVPILAQRSLQAGFGPDGIFYNVQHRAAGIVKIHVVKLARVFLPGRVAAGLSVLGVRRGGILVDVENVVHRGGGARHVPGAHGNVVRTLRQGRPGRSGDPPRPGIGRNAGGAGRNKGPVQFSGPGPAGAGPGRVLYAVYFRAAFVHKGNIINIARVGVAPGGIPALRVVNLRRDGVL